MLEDVLKEERNLIQIAGPYQSHHAHASGLTIETESGAFEVTLYSPQMVRVHAVGPFRDTNPYAVIKAPKPPIFNVKETGERICIQTEQFDVEINKDPLTFKFLTKEGKVINEDDPGLGTQRQGDQLTVYKKLQEGERFVGLGEKTGPLDRRGNGYQNWNTDHFAYGLEADPIYSSIPFYIGIHDGLSYGIFLDNSYKSHFNFGASNNRFASFSVDAGDMDYYFINGSVPAILEAYTWLTGRIQLPPLWSIGYQQCRYSYYPQSEVLSVAGKFREKNIPADVMVLDIHHMDAYKIFSWDKEKFPDPDEMIAKLKEMGFEVTVICDPGIKIEKDYEPYDTGLEQQVFIKYPDESLYEGEVWPGWCHFPDFTKEKTRLWWQELMKSYTEIGVKGFWNDMNEIATWGQQLPENILFSMEGQQATSRKARNIYGFQMTRSALEGAKANLKGARPFVLTRAGFSGVQRYSALWTGDNVADDDHMLLGVRLVNSLGLSGVAFSGYDVGGFVDDGDGKLFARWAQLGAFSPFFRGHSMINSKDAEPWSYGEEVEEISTNYIRLRYRLLPYLYAAFLKASNTGVPIAKSLVFEYAHDDKIYEEAFENQYQFGDALLVAPIKSDRQFLKTYLPEGDWYDFFTDQFFSGSQELIREYELEHLPLFVKASSIIPVYPGIGVNTKAIGEVLELHVYHGTSANSVTYYEDDGTTYQFAEGHYHQRYIRFEPDKRAIILEEAAGDYLSKMRQLRIVLHGFGEVSDSFSQEQYAFVEAISHFDPIYPPKPHYLQSEVFVLATNYGNNEIVIEW